LLAAGVYDRDLMHKIEEPNTGILDVDMDTSDGASDSELDQGMDVGM
jgi:hypothetical protein